MKMNKRLTTLVIVAPLLVLALTPPVRGQEGPSGVRAPEVITAVRSDISPPLGEMPVMALPDGPRQIIPLMPRPRPDIRSDAADPLAREASGPGVLGLKLNFDGQGATGRALPPNTNGAVGLTQYVQWVANLWNVYDKNTGTKLGGPFLGQRFWAGFGGRCQMEDGYNPIIQYDKAAGRWVAMQRAGNFDASICFAVSTTPDALGAYARYEYDFGFEISAEPKLGVWPDAYYVTSKTYLPPGSPESRPGIALFPTFFGAKSVAQDFGAKPCAMDRAKMLAGLPAPTAICFQLSEDADNWLLPADLDGPTPPPPGSPNYHIGLGTSTNLRLFKFHVDFVVPANSTFTGPTLLSVASYSELCYSQCVPQPSPGELLDGRGDRLMYRLPYRNFGDHETIVANHSVNNGGVAGVRWYEIRDLSKTPSVFQQGTVAAGSVHLWMGSIAQDKMGNIAVGFSASNSVAVKPSIGVAGRLPGDAPGTMRTPRALMIGTGVQLAFGSGDNWGSYSAMAVDPIDDCTLWYTTEYLKTNGSFNWSTRISSFTFPNCS
jgi:hypothetical protein